MTTAKNVPHDLAFKEQLEHELREFFRDLAASVCRGELFLSGKVAATTLVLLTRLAVYDRWFEYSDEELGKRLKVDQGELDALRNHDYAAAVKAELEDAFQVVAIPHRLRDHLADERTEHALFRRQMTLARQGGDLKVAERAIANLQERVMPTNRKEESGGSQVIVRIEQVALIQAADEALLRAGVETERLPEVIDVGEEKNTEE